MLGMWVVTKPVVYFGLPVVEIVCLPEPDSIAQSCDISHRSQDRFSLACGAFSTLEDDIEVVVEFWGCTGVRYSECLGISVRIIVRISV